MSGLVIWPPGSMWSRRGLGIGVADRADRRGDDPLPVGPDLHAEAEPDPPEPQEAPAEARPLEARRRRIGEEAAALHEDLVAARHDDVVPRVARLDDQGGERRHGSERHTDTGGRRSDETVERRRRDTRPPGRAGRIDAAGTVGHWKAAGIVPPRSAPAGEEPR